MPRSVSARVGRAAFLGAIITFGVAVTAYGSGVRLNLSGSIPPGFYRTVKGPMRRGAIVLACLPPAASVFARSRGFVPDGSCVGGSALIGKTVAAIRGDTVDATPIGIAVNGRLIHNSRPLTTDSERRPLHPFGYGRYVVPADEVWLVSSYSQRSFDSRYFGPVAIDCVVARILPLLTF